MDTLLFYTMETRANKRLVVWFHLSFFFYIYHMKYI